MRVPFCALLFAFLLPLRPRPRRKPAATSPARSVTDRASFPAPRSRSRTPTPTSARTSSPMTSGYFEAPLLNPGTYAVTRADARLSKRRRATSIVLGVGQQLTVPFTLEVGADQRRGRGHGGDAAARHHSLSSGANFDTPPGREPADVLEHADHAGALRAGRERQRCSRRRCRRATWTTRRCRPAPASACRWPARRTRHAAGRRQQLHDRRRQQQRQQPPHRRVAQLRHDSGDARRVVELRRRRRPRPRPADLDDDARRHEHSSAARSTTSTGRTSSTR